MNRFLLGCLVLVMCSSCSVYQYNVLRSDMPGKGDEPFTFENDTLRLSYSFSDGWGNISIFNKTNRALYVDWSRSSLIVDNSYEPYWVPEDVNAPVTFVPPQSGMTAVPFNVSERYKPAVTSSKPVERRYTVESSPLKFRSFLFLSFEHDFYYPITFDHTFWLAAWQQTQQFNVMKEKQNTYSTSVMTEGGSAAVGVAALAGIILAVVLRDEGNEP